MAQDRPPDESYRDTSRVVALEPVVVTATRTARDLEDVAVPVTIVTADEIRATGAVRLADVLVEQTGLALFEDHGTGVQIQGFSPDYTLMLIDGEPVIGRTAGTLSLERLTTNGISRIEIVRGPSSSLYGSEALAGVINLIPDEPAEGRSASFNARYGTYGASDLTGTLEAGNSLLGARLLVNRYASNGYDLTPAVFGPTTPDFADHSADVRVRYQPGRRVTLRLGGRMALEKQESAFALIENGAEIPYDQSDERFEWSFHPEIRYQLNPGLNGELSYYDSGFQTETRMERSSDGFSYFFDDFDQRYHKVEVLFHAAWNRTNLSTFGGGWIQETLGGSRYIDGPSARNAFVYGQHEWLPSRWIELNLSARFDAHSDYASRISPKASVLIRPLKNVRFKASIGSGFKAPDFRQLYLSFTNAAAGYNVFGATELRTGLERLQKDGQITDVFIDPVSLTPIRAENSLAYNAGIVAGFFPWLELNVNLFHNDVRDLIETQPVAQKTNGSFVYGYFNLNRIYTQGIEAEVTLTPLQHPDRTLTISTGYQYLRARDRDIERAIKAGSVFGRTPSGRDYRLSIADYGGLLGRSPHSGTVRVMAADRKHDLTATLRGVWRSRYGYRDVDGNLLPNRADEYIPRYTVWNLTVTKSWAVSFGETVTLQFGIENLLDVKRPALIPSMPGRLWYAGFGIDF